MKRIIVATVLVLAIQCCCKAQISRAIDSLTRLSTSDISDLEKVKVLGQLADLCFAYKLDSKADTCLRMQLTLAEISNNREILEKALFGEAITNSGSQLKQETRSQIITFIQKGIDYARSKNEEDYLALAYCRMSHIQLGVSYDKALSYATQALSSLHNISSDSIKAVVYIQIADVYQAKTQSEEAFRNYAIAFDIAQKTDNIFLQSLVLRKFAHIYRTLGDKVEAANYLYQSLTLNTDNNNPKGMVQDYIELFKIKEDEVMGEKAIELAKKYGLSKQVLVLKRVMLALYLVRGNDANRALNYLNNDPELKASYVNAGISNYYYQVGNIYRYSCIPDSGIKYYNLAIQDLATKFGSGFGATIDAELAACYSLKKNYDSAIYYFSRTLDHKLAIHDVAAIRELTDSLSNMYASAGDYKSSYEYGKRSQLYRDSINLLANSKDIALKEVERQKRARDLMAQEEKDRIDRLHNIQIMGITIAITVVFVLFLVLGMFPISKVTIRIFGYFFFICLFEFIVLLIDKYLGRITHHEPLKIWIIKIFLIAALVPMQHFMEHGLIKFLSSRKLLEARQKLSIKKWWKTVKKSAPGKGTDIEEGTAVL